MSAADGGIAAPSIPGHHQRLIDRPAILNKGHFTHSVIAYAAKPADGARCGAMQR
jgi:hypothetical protein